MTNCAIPDRRRVRLGVPRDGPTAPLARFVEATPAIALRPWFQTAASLRVYHASGLIQAEGPPNLRALALANTVPLRLVLTADDATGRLILATLAPLSSRALQIWLLEAAMQLLGLEQAVGRLDVDSLIAAPAASAAPPPVPPAPPTPRATSPPDAPPPPTRARPDITPSSGSIPIEELGEDARQSLRAILA